MKAMILAAGLGTRLRPLTHDLPKALLPVNGRPVIHYTLLLLKKYGITEVIINLHHQGQKIMDALGSGAGLDLKISYSYEPEILGTGGGIRKVWRRLSDGTFLVMNSDILVDLNLDKVVEFHRRKRAIATLVLRKDQEADTWGAVEIDSKEQVRRIRGEPSWKKEGLIKRMFTGIHVMEPRIFEFMPAAGQFNIMDVYLNMIRQGERIAGYTMKGYWMDIGAPERYRKTREDLERGDVRLGYLRNNGRKRASRND